MGEHSSTGRGIIYIVTVNLGNFWHCFYWLISRFFRRWRRMRQNCSNGVSLCEDFEIMLFKREVI